MVSQRRIWASLLIFLLVLSSFSGLGVQAQSQPDVSFDTIEMSSAEEKVSPEVQDAFKEDAFVDVLIKLNSQVDTSQVVTEARQQHTAQTTQYQEKMNVRYAVVDALQTHAKESQKGILTFLEKQQNNGEVKEINAYFIVNMIHAKVSKEVADTLAKRGDVASILPDAHIEIDWPEERQPSQAGTEESSTETEATSTSSQEDESQGDEPRTQSVEWNIDRVEAPAVWDTYGVDGTGVVVGLIDTGADWQHEALMDNWRGYDPQQPENPNPVGNWFDAVNGEEMPYDISSVPHGTHVLGTILGQDPAGNEVIGVAPGAQWIAVKAFTAAGGQSSWLLAAGEYMLAPINENGDPDPSLAPDVINNSWGGGPGLDEWYRPMVQAWRDANILPVFAAGNSSGGSQPGSVSTPANYPESVAVAATDSQDLRASFSNQGPGPYDDDIKPDLSAPGANIRSSVPGGYEAGWNGTSMASPHVVGTAALMLSMDTALAVDDLEEVMLDTARPLTDDQYEDAPNYGYGFGLVNAFEAVATIAQGRGEVVGTVTTEGQDDTSPTISHDPIEQLYAGLDVEIEASVEDDVAVTKAELWVKPDDATYWTVIPMNRVSGDHQSGSYRGVIPWMFVQEPGLTYQIKAVDYGHNLSETDEYPVEVQFGVRPDEYETDFSQSPLGWDLSGDWEWGRPSVGPSPIVGEQLVATNLAGEYSNGSDSYMLMPPLDLRDTNEASVRFNHWHDIENNFDEGVLAISDDYGETWDIIDVFTGRDQTWRSYVADLNQYVGSENPVMVLYGFFSDGSVTYPGWYVDNVQLKGVDHEPPSAPTALEAYSTSSGILLQWEAPTDPDLKGYTVYRSDSAGGAYEPIGETTDTSWTDSRVEAHQTYYYVVTAYDYSDNESEFSNEESATALETVTLYFSDFEADNGGFVTDGDSSEWEWGIPTSGPGEAASGESLWATNLSGDYSNSSDSGIMSPTLDLTDVQDAELTFTHWYNIERNYDQAYVRITTDDGATFEDIASYSERRGEWSDVTISLRDYVGEEIRIQFLFTSDLSVTYPGWYIDDVRVSGVRDASTLEVMSDEASVDSEENQAEVVAEKPEEDKREKLETLLSEFQLQEDESAYTFYDESEATLLRSSGLPLDAVLTVVETGRSVRTDPATGEYRLIHPATEEGEQWTLRAESYGYHSEEATFSLADEDRLEQHFQLDPVPRGDLVGEVVDERTGAPIEQAQLKLVEDHRVPAIHTDEQGSFHFDDVLEGSYTLEISADNYHIARETVHIDGEEETSVAIALKPFIGYDQMIAYDDGTAENARAFYDEGNGWAMRMSPDGQAQIKGASVYLWGEDWPTPGADAFSVTIYDSQTNGQPGERLIDPVVVDGERGGWNYVDLSEFGLSTDQDFYVVFVQIGDNPDTPGLGFDEDGTFSDRAYMVVDGAFQKLDESYGNAMIRANVSYALSSPTITAPEDQSFTNETHAVVEGQVQADSVIRIYRNEEQVAEATSIDQAFQVEVPLEEGENHIQATASVEAGETDPSEAITVIRDTVEPELYIDGPTDGSVTNKEVVTVTGQATDEYLAQVTVNDEAVSVDDDGGFAHRIMLDEGQNTLSVVATDQAGNAATETLEVTVNTEAPVLSELQPSENVQLYSGEQVQVSFMSEEGGQATFAILLPMGTADADAESQTRIQMEEVTPGHYQGQWTAPEHVQFEDATIEVTFEDQAGNQVVETTPGKLSVVAENPPPTEEDISTYTTRLPAAQLVEASTLVSQEGWAQSDSVILAHTGQTSEILAATLLSAQWQAPILVTDPSQLSAEVQEELARLNAREVTLLGNANMISDQIEQELDTLGLDVTRLTGKNTDEVTVSIAEVAGITPDTAVLVHRDDHDKALTAASYAAVQGVPIFYTDTRKVSNTVNKALEALDINQLIVLGNEQRIEDHALRKLPTAERVWHDSSVELSYVLADRFGLGSDIVLVSADAYHAAHTSGTLAAQKNTGTILVEDTVSDELETLLSTNAITHAYLVGEDPTISGEVQYQIARILKNN
ncbi:S8 family serine peptidase [Caldalkalibacillus salinus]|uniref:S8 family serine peptidase n=1 Tax=Caldalkalibacillus salinus TaxID=2803787 RepID=UPI0019226DA0|nr:S8 family serine peptidase [Caldalkalibacillus salinus]